MQRLMLQQLSVMLQQLLPAMLQEGWCLWETTAALSPWDWKLWWVLCLLWLALQCCAGPDCQVTMLLLSPVLVPATDACHPVPLPAAAASAAPAASQLAEDLLHHLHSVLPPGDYWQQDRDTLFLVGFPTRHSTP
jgi:hypothetical protein